MISSCAKTGDFGDILHPLSDFKRNEEPPSGQNSLSPLPSRHYFAGFGLGSHQECSDPEVAATLLHFSSRVTFAGLGERHQGAPGHSEQSEHVGQ